jgi:hypothetical protein
VPCHPFSRLDSDTDNHCYGPIGRKNNVDA